MPLEKKSALVTHTNTNPAIIITLLKKAVLSGFV